MNINIMGHSWFVAFKNKEYLSKYGSECLGVALFPSREIYIQNDLKNDELLQVATHEVTHAYLDEFGLGSIDNYNTEFICDFVSNNIKKITDITEEVIFILTKNKVEVI